MQERRKEVLKKDSGDDKERRQGIARNNEERDELKTRNWSQSEKFRGQEDKLNGSAKKRRWKLIRTGYRTTRWTILMTFSDRGAVAEYPLIRATGKA